MKKHLFVLALLAAYLSSGAASAGRLHARAARSVMPSLSNAKTLLNTTTRHREWVNVATGSSPMLAFVVYPERAEKLPAANGRSAWVNLGPVGDRADVTSDAHGANASHIRGTPAAWPELVAHLSHVTGNNPAFIEGRTAPSIDEHAAHMGRSMAMA